MKKHTLLIVIFVAISISYSCATKIPFEQTCLTCVISQRIACIGSECPETIMAGNNCITTFPETGEKINLNYILFQEKITPQNGIPLTLAKIRGRYFVIGKDFSNLWVLTPSCEKAKVKRIPLPEKGLSLPPVFEMAEGNLLMRSANNEYSFIYDIKNKKWITHLRTKAGA